MDGAKLELENAGQDMSSRFGWQVKAGYADIPRDVLKGITLCLEPGLERQHIISYGTEASNEGGHCGHHRLWKARA